MPGTQLFEYAVIRVVPRVEREEFVNTGVVLYCRDANYLRLRFEVNERRIRCLCEQLDLSEVKQHLEAFEAICEGRAAGGPIGRLDIASRFRWLTAMRSTVVQTSRVHPGLCNDPEEMLQRLYNQLVG